MSGSEWYAVSNHVESICKATVGAGCLIFVGIMAGSVFLCKEIGALRDAIKKKEEEKLS